MWVLNFALNSKQHFAPMTKPTLRDDESYTSCRSKITFHATSKHKLRANSKPIVSANQNLHFAPIETNTSRQLRELYFAPNWIYSLHQFPTYTMRQFWAYTSWQLKTTSRSFINLNFSSKIKSTFRRSRILLYAPSKHAFRSYLYSKTIEQAVFEQDYLVCIAVIIDCWTPFLSVLR